MKTFLAAGSKLFEKFELRREQLLAQRPALTRSFMSPIHPGDRGRTGQHRGGGASSGGFSSAFDLAEQCLQHSRFVEQSPVNRLVRGGD